MLTSNLYTGEQPTPKVEIVFDSCPTKPKQNSAWVRDIAKDELRTSANNYLSK